MPSFRVQAEAIYTTQIDVEAEDEDEAHDKARGLIEDDLSNIEVAGANADFDLYQVNVENVEQIDA